MSSIIYSGGVQATAVAGIISAINARMETLPDGSIDLNRESLEAWLRDQFNQMASLGEAPSAGYVATLDVGALVRALSDAVRPETMQRRPDYPHDITPETAIAAVSRMQGELRTLSAAVSAVYAKVPEQIGDTIVNYLDANNIQGKVPAGVTREVRDRSYIVTFVTDRGEESAPSPVSDPISLDQNDYATVQRPDAPVGRNIAWWRLYRSADGNARADFELVVNPGDVSGIPIVATTFPDTAKDNQLGETCRTGTWLEPPADLVHVKAGPNGINAGHTAQTWYCTVPYFNYAWVLERGKTTDYPIVNHAVVDQSWIVLTQGRPYLISGMDPTSMTSRKLDCTESCSAARSVVEVPGGVAYASPNGIVLIDAAGNYRIMTADHFEKPQWEAMNPASIYASYHDGCYVFGFTGNGGGFYSLHLGTGKLQKRTMAGSAFFRDLPTDALFMAEGTTIKRVFGSTSRKTGLWRSKRVVLNTTGFKFVRAVSTFDAPVTVRIYANDDTDTMALWDSVVLTDRGAQILREGTAERWELEVESSAQSVSAVVLATSVEEIDSV